MLSRSPLSLTVGILLGVTWPLAAQTVTITIDPQAGRVPVSPYLYGKNDSVGSPTSPIGEADWVRFRDSGVQMLRMNGGNNSTKYNWKKKLSSHPDWYNNVYVNDWDYAQSQLQAKLPGVQSMWAFQLIGKVAANTTNNFNDWDYNRSQWWEGIGQNLAGGGVVNTAGGSKATTNGNPNLYLEDTNADTSTAILDHWMSPTGLGLDRRQFRYWNMDNEPEIWEGTHDDVMPKQLAAEAFMQRYFEYAKRARARFPEIKLVGPVAANEWQWYNWSGGIQSGGRSYPWVEYFIKRIAEEEKLTGLRLLDVLDLHYYPGATRPEDIVQLHRTFFDRTYINPDANGVKAVNGGWDDSIRQEYIFGRCRDWMDQYFGKGHGVTLAVSETGIQVTDAPLASVWYASLLGEFMREGVEVLTPWTWQPGMWEVLHLFARYNQPVVVKATSDVETTVSPYVTVNPQTGAMTLVLVNRALTANTTTQVDLTATGLADGAYEVLQLANLPASETFVSHTTNALARSSVALSGRRLSLVLPPLSITSVLLPGALAPEPAPVASQITNLSVRAKSGTGADALIVGFVVAGSGSKDILVRAIGPSLKPFGIASPLADPQMTLVPAGGGASTLNDNWGTSADAITPVAGRLGAFSLDTRSLDAALVSTLPPGGYTARIVDATGGSGIALGEVYDAGGASGARLFNVSARTWVGVGEDCLIAGFVVTGGQEKRLLIRGVGPRLSFFSVPGVLANPVLQVFRQGEERPLFVNDDWSTLSYSEDVKATSSSAGAFELAAGSKDAVLLVSLPPGIYSAVLTGVGKTTGVALVEVYELP